MRSGAAGIASVLPESRPCKAGDVHRVTSDEWDSNLALKKVAWEVPGHKDLRTAGSDAVRLMQRALIQWGCRQATPARYPLPTYGVDGDYGQETKNAVRQLQRDQQLVADGVAGPKTVRAMQANLGFLEVSDQVDIDSLYEYAEEIGANGASSSSAAPAVLFDAEIGTSTKIEVNIVGHASPRWLSPGANDGDALNMALSWARAEHVAYEIQSWLDFIVPGGITTHLRTPDGATDTELRKRGRGIIDTLDEAQGDMLADTDDLRRTDIDVRMTDGITDAVGFSEEGDPTLMPLKSQCERRKSRKWGITPAGVAGGGKLVFGAGTIVGTMRNIEKHGAVTFLITMKGLGVGLPAGVTASHPSESEFETDEPLNFQDFDGTRVRVTMGTFSGGMGPGYMALKFKGVKTDPRVLRSLGWNYGLDFSAINQWGRIHIFGSYSECDDTPGEELQPGEGMSSYRIVGWESETQMQHRAYFENRIPTLSDDERERLRTNLSSTVNDHWSRRYEPNDEPNGED